MKGGKSINHHELTQMLNNDSAVVLDIRDKKEFSAGHIAGAVNVPFSKLSTSTAELDAHKEKMIVVVDKQGQHSGSAGRTLSKLGYQVNRLNGGMMMWTSEKLPVIK